MDKLSQLEEKIYSLYKGIKCQLENNVSFKDEDIRKIDIFQIIEYIKSSTEILISHRVEREINKYKEEMSKKSGSQDYEEIIIKLENHIRNHIKVK